MHFLQASQKGRRFTDRVIIAIRLAITTITSAFLKELPKLRLKFSILLVIMSFMQIILT